VGFVCIEVRGIRPICTAVILLYLFGISVEVKEGAYTYKEQSRIIVSSAPPYQTLDGSIHFFLGMGGGSFGESTTYLLREEISKGLYLDFKGNHKVYIQEDASLKTKGKFIQTFDCVSTSHYVDLFGIWKTGSTKPKETCKYSKQTIIVPIGHVIKHISI